MKMFGKWWVILAIICFGWSFQALGEEIVLETSNTVTLRGVIDDKSIGQTIQKLILNNSPTIYLYITSPGGQIIAGERLVQYLKTTDKNIECIADFAASMAFIILQHCKARYIMGDSIIMQHEASLGAQGELPNFLSWVKLITGIVTKLEKSQAKRIGITHKQYRSKIANDWWMHGTEAVVNKAADKQVNVTCSRRLMRTQEKQIIISFFGVIKLHWSGCPLIAYPVKVNDKSTMDDPNEFKNKMKFFIKDNWTPSLIKEVNRYNY